MPPPPCDHESAKSRLYDEFRVEAPIVRWNDQTLIRVSIRAYNSDGEVDRLLQAMRVVLFETQIEPRLRRTQHAPCQGDTARVRLRSLPLPPGIFMQ